METHEREIIKAIEQGQTGIQMAVELLMERYVQPVYEYCFYTLNDAFQAQKITAQTFLKAPVVLLNYKGGRLLVLLEQIAYELCVAQRPALRFEEGSVDEEEQNLMRGALSEGQRIVLYLRKQELKWREVGQILGISEVAARQRGSRAERRLAEVKDVSKRP